MFPTRRTYVVPLADHRELRLGERPLVMGILNVTPDSFAEASPSFDSAIAIDRAIQMEEEGADILDVGGESTRPGTEPVTASEELSRVLPVVKALVRRVRVPISVDTYRADVARAVIAEGATIINDISGLRYEPQLAEVAAGSQVALVLMHMRGRPKTMYEEAVYHDLMAEVVAELRASMAVAAAAGVASGRVIVDPGVGFAKQPNHSYGVLARLSTLAVGARPARARGSVAEVLHARSAGRPARAGAGLGHGGGRDGGCARRRPHRPCPRGGRNGAGCSRGGGNTTPQ